MKFNNRNIFISSKAIIGANVKIGDNVTIYDHVNIGDNTVICNDCVLGEPLAAYYDNPDNYENPPLIIGDNSLVRSHSILYAGSVIGEFFSSGHRVTIREFSNLGQHCRVGTSCDLQGHITIGDYCWFHSFVQINQQSQIGNFVFLYPYVILTNDLHPPSENIVGVTIADYAQVGAGTIVLPGKIIRQHALVAAGSVVTRDVDEYALVAGNPAKFVKDIRGIMDRNTNQPYYPWPDHFERGMPWQGIGYQQWLMNKK